MENQLQDSGQYVDTLINLFVVWGPKLVGAILALIIGLWLANMIAGGMNYPAASSGVSISRNIFSIAASCGELIPQ